MKRKTIPVFLVVLMSCLYGKAQIVADTFFVPPYPVPALYFTDSAPELPDNVWNHKLKYFPDSVIYQIGPTCGQTSGIFNCLTYMFNRAFDREADYSNTFPPNYTFNQLSMYNGVSTFDSWNVVKSQGHPGRTEYETINLNPDSGSHSFLLFWMNGYENYYKSFFNRISGYYSLDVSSESDLIILKHFFNDKFEEGLNGGVAVFMTNPLSETTPDTILFLNDLVIPGTHSGFNVIDTIFYNELPTHQMTLAGYYKNEVVDFNGDGFITDSLDINHDGIIDMHDNETTMWIALNSYGEGSKAYFLLKYDVLNLFWNKQVFFPIPDTTYSPELTFKIRLRHHRRGNLKISAGISTDLNSDKPEILLDFPVFNFNGGPFCMKGVDSLEDSDLLEFGIDITDIKNYIQKAGTYKVFMKIENNGLPEGQLQYFSIIDYSNNIGEENVIVNSPEIIYSGTNFYSTIMNLESNDYNNYVRVITPVVNINRINNETNISIEAEGGQAPYKYSVIDETRYKVQSSLKEYPPDTGLIYDSVYSKALNLNWMVPFSDGLWDSLKVANSGEITFYSEPIEVIAERYPYELYNRNNNVPILSPYARSFFWGSYLKPIAIRSSDSEIEIYHKDRKRINAINYYYPDHYTKITKDGVVEIIYSDSISRDIICANIRSNIGNYYMPYADYKSEIFNTVTFTPMVSGSLFSIDTNGLLTMQPVSDPGKYETYVLVKDVNGQEFTKRIEVEIMGNGLIGSFYPNPVSNLVSLDIYSETDGIANFEISNVSGQIVVKFKNEIHVGINNLSFSVKQFSINKGTYLCKVSYDDNIEVIKFVVVE